MTRRTRRDVIKGVGALSFSAFAFRAGPARAAEAITPALVDAAKKEGKVTFYTAMDLQLAEHYGKSFEQRYPGISVQVERSGSERIFTRIEQEQGSNIRVVDVVNTSDLAHCLVWKKRGWLESYLPEDVARHYDKAYYDDDG